MATDRQDPRSHTTFRTLAASALALVFAAAGLQAQQGQVTTDEIEKALSNPDQQIKQMETQQAMKAVTVVDLESIYPDRQQADEVKQQHGDAVQKFQKQAEEHETVTRALESEGISPDDVVAIYVGSPMQEEQGQAGQQQQQEGEGAEREEMAVHQVMYVVVSGLDRDQAGQRQEMERPQPDTTTQPDTAQSPSGL